MWRETISLAKLGCYFSSEMQISYANFHEQLPIFKIKYFEVVMKN